MAGSGTAHLRGDGIEPVLEVQHLVVEFPTARGRVHAVSDVSLDVANGETVGIVGESGCGKSTVGRAIMRVPPPTSGRVRMNGVDLARLSGGEMRELRSRLQMVFQDASASLNPRQTIRQIVAEPLMVRWLESYPRSFLVRSWERYVPAMLRLWRAPWLRYAVAGFFAVFVAGLLIWVGGDATGQVEADGTRDGGAVEAIGNAVMVAALAGLAPLAAIFAVTAGAWLVLTLVMPVAAIPRFVRIRRDTNVFWRDADGKVRRVLTDVGIDPDVALDRRPHEFSGGQAQRIGIARALIVDPAVVICDEPVAALDVSVQAQVLNLLEDLKAKYGISLIFIAHDMAVVKSISDRVVVMYLGKICEVADPDRLFSDPAHPYTSILMSAIPVADPTVDPRAGRRVSGELPSPITPPSGCRFRTRCPSSTHICGIDEPQLRKIHDDQYVACHHPVGMRADETRPGETPGRNASPGQLLAG